MVSPDKILAELSALIEQVTLGPNPVAAAEAAWLLRWYEQVSGPLSSDKTAWLDGLKELVGACFVMQKHAAHDLRSHTLESIIGLQLGFADADG